jgi:hypothetical protein
MSARLHAVTSTWDQLITKKADATGITAGWQIQRNNADNVVFWSVANGSAEATANAAGTTFTASTRLSAIGVSGDATDHEIYQDGVSLDTDATSITSTTSADNLRVGGSTASPADVMAVHAVAVLSKRVSDSEAVRISDELEAA